MTSRTKIAHNGIIYKVIETLTVEAIHKDYSAIAERLRNNGIVATHSVRRPNGRKVYMLDEFANGTTGNLMPMY